VNLKTKGDSLLEISEKALDGLPMEDSRLVQKLRELVHCE
jgi:hypothetical protein